MKINKHRLNEKALKESDLDAKVIASAWEEASQQRAITASGDPEIEFVLFDDEAFTGITELGQSHMEEFKGGASFEIPVLIPEEVESGDSRTFAKDSISVVDGPIPLMWQQFSQKGHDGSVIVGRIDHVERINSDDNNAPEESVNGIKYGWGKAYGTFDTGPFAREAERLVREGYLRHVSADMDKFEAQSETSAEAAEDDDGIIKNNDVTINKARIIGATLVAKPAFQEAQIFIKPDIEEFPMLPIEDGIYEEEMYDEFAVQAAITASAIPVTPPSEWFENPRLDGPTPLVVNDDGHVFGHIATWDMAHIGIPGATKPPHSRSNYAYFRTGVVRTDSGKDVPVGQITLAGGHAALDLDVASAIKHYDDTATAVADVAAGEDAYGIWVAGAMRPGVTGDQVRVLRASASSGDWRPIRGRLELVAICQVNVPGFPIARTMVAGGQPLALVAAGARTLAEIRSHTLEDRLVEVEKRLYREDLQPAFSVLDELEETTKRELEDAVASSKSLLDSLEAEEKEKNAALVASLESIFNSLE